MGFARALPILRQRLQKWRRFTCQTTMRTRARILGARLAPELASISRLEKTEGAGKAGCRSHPWAPCEMESTGVGPQVNRSDPAFPARWVTAYFVLSPVTGCLPPSPARCGCIGRLDASI